MCYGVSERRESIVLRKNWSLESGWLLSASPRAAVQVPFKSICTTCMCTQPSVHNPVTPIYYSSLVLVYLWSSGEFPIFLSLCTTCFGLFKLPTCGTLRIGRGHSTLESRCVCTPLVLQYLTSCTSYIYTWQGKSVASFTGVHPPMQPCYIILHC